ncbi:unnamed protein product, partial [Symbiodinium sp. CCMP2456]
SRRSVHDVDHLGAGARGGHVRRSGDRAVASADTDSRADRRVRSEARGDGFGARTHAAVDSGSAARLLGEPVPKYPIDVVRPDGGRARGDGDARHAANDDDAPPLDELADRTRRARRLRSRGWPGARSRPDGRPRRRADHRPSRRPDERHGTRRRRRPGIWRHRQRLRSNLLPRDNRRLCRRRRVVDAARRPARNAPSRPTGERLLGARNRQRLHRPLGLGLRARHPRFGAAAIGVVPRHAGAWPHQPHAAATQHDGRRLRPQRDAHSRRDDGVDGRRRLRLPRPPHVRHHLRRQFGWRRLGRGMGK